MFSNFSMRMLIVLALVSLGAGCASRYVPPTPAYKMKQNSKVGVLVLTKDTPTHTHVGTTIFNNFVKEYDFQWQLKQSIFEQFKNTIESNSEIQVVDLETLNFSNAREFNFVGIR